MFNKIALDAGFNFFYFGITTGILFAVAIFFLIFTLINAYIRKRKQVAEVFFYGMLAHFSYGLYNIYSLQIHFEPAQLVFPPWFLIACKLALPVGLYFNFKILIKTTPIHSSEAFALWHKSKPILKLIDLLYLITLCIITFIDSLVTITMLGFLISFLHCLSGGYFSLKSLKPKHISKLYAFAMFALSTLFLGGFLLLCLFDYHNIPHLLFNSMHLLCSLLILICGFSLITFIIETNLPQNEVSTFNIDNLDKNVYQALKTNEFFVVYQPKFNIKTNKVEGLEALIRWQHAKRGLIMPNQFISMLEKTPIINDICHFMIDKVIQEIKENHISVPISINFSVKNLNQTTANYLLTKLKENQLPHDAIIVEITESFLLDMSEEQKSTLLLFKEAGINLSLDDFGAGYSSLKYLDELKLSELKIDRDITKKILEPTNKTIVTNLINMCNELNVKVVAEGVENDLTVLALKQINCHVIQGYVISKPKKMAQIIKWMNETS